MVIKRYGNRRLYDTDASRYVTLDEAATRIRNGEDVRFMDVPTGEDITQAFLAQIIFESRGAAKLLPIPLLYRMVRLGDDALAEFFGRYVTWALDVYLKMKQGARTVASVNPLAALPLAASDALMRWVGGWGQPQPSPWSPAWQAPPSEPFPPPPSPEEVLEDDRDARQDGELARLRTELDALKKLLREALSPRDG
jgi:polyhydroxyalkanoate synthesis repressor PhaR